MAEKPYDQFKDPFAGRDRNGTPSDVGVDLWSIPKHFHGQIRSLVWRWEKTPEGHYNWVVMIPSLPIAEFSIPFDRLSLRAFATEIIRMLDHAEVSSETSTD
jgi:hypothetical protein